MSATFPRDPSAYRPDPGGHFRRRKSEEKVPGWAIREAIKNGEVLEGEGHEESRIKLRTNLDENNGARFYVVLDVDDMVAVTCGRCG